MKQVLTAFVGRGGAQGVPLRFVSPSKSVSNFARSQRAPHVIAAQQIRHLASTSEPNHEDSENTQEASTSSTKQPQRRWIAGRDASEPWTGRVADCSSTNISELLDRLERQETTGGRLQTQQLGVLHEDPGVDMHLLTQNYTLPAVASALRDREDALQRAAVLAEGERWDELKDVLKIFHPESVLRRRNEGRRIDLTHSLDLASLEVIRKALMRMPRTVTTGHLKRAGVVVPLCVVDGVPSLLLEKRATSLRAHPDEVCLPGGMVCEMSDQTIVATCLREFEEEIDGLDLETSCTVLGVLRCNWGEVHSLTGVAVTPVVCWLGELPDDLRPNPSEVSEVFTLPLVTLCDKSLWVQKEGLAPIHLGGPYPIWGLTGYILFRFWKDILRPNSAVSPDTVGNVRL